MSHFFAQFVGTYFSAESTLPVSRLATKKNPLRSAFIIAGTVVAADLEVGEHELVDAVIVPGVFRRALDVPLDLAGVGIERQRRSGVEVGELAEIAVAGASGRAVFHGPGLLVPQKTVLVFGIVGADQPGRAAAVLGRYRPSRCRCPARPGAGTVKVFQTCLPVLMS